jgi:hypothetical protein
MKPLADRLYEEIEKTLKDYRLSRMQCEDGGAYPLTDALTPPGESIQAGYDEIEMICDSIYNRVLTPHFNNVRNVPEELIVDVWSSMPDGHNGFMKSWGFVQFSRNLLERVMPIQKPSKPRAWMKVGPSGSSLGVTDMEWEADNWKREGSKVVPLFAEILEFPVDTDSPTSLGD